MNSGEKIPLLIQQPSVINNAYYQPRHFQQALHCLQLLTSVGSNHLKAKAKRRERGKQPRQHQKPENELKINGGKIIAEIRDEVLVGGGRKASERKRAANLHRKMIFIIFSLLFISFFISFSKYKNFSSHLLFSFYCWFLRSYFCSAIIKIYLVGPRPGEGSSAERTFNFGCMISREERGTLLSGTI